MARAPITQADGERLQSLFAAAERIAHTGSWEFLPETEELLWSDNLYRIFGLEPRAIKPTVEYLLATTHPDDRQHLTEVVVALTGDVEYRITRPDGDRRHLRSTLALTERCDDQPHRVIGVVEDLTDRRRAEREIAAHVAVQEALVAWEDLDTGAYRLVARLADALDCVSGVFWVNRAGFLVPRVFWHESGVHPKPEPASARTPLRSASGLASRALEARRPLSWTLSDAGHAAGPPVAAADTAQATGAVAIPALMGDEVLAVVELRTDREIRVSERLRRSLYGIAHELGDFLARRRGELTVALLTPREVEMLQLAAHGLSARETAERLTVSPATVRTHLENIYRKLDVSDKPSAVATALRLGVID